MTTSLTERTALWIGGMVVVSQGRQQWQNVSVIVLLAIFNGRTANRQSLCNYLTEYSTKIGRIE